MSHIEKLEVSAFAIIVIGLLSAMILGAHAVT
jgi:hypothetical protein